MARPSATAAPAATRPTPPAVETSVPPPPAAPARRTRRAAADAPDSTPKPRKRTTKPRPTFEPGTDLVPMTTVDAMERLSGELYLAGQRAARAEAVAEMRLRRLGDVEERNAALEQELGRLREERQELLQRLALAEARVMVMDDAPPARWLLRRRG
jgi:DNA gyrase/topoisomerase IV subunit A